jgi:hypothetical protein
MIKNFFKALALIIIFNLLSCSSEQNPIVPVNESNPIMPLSVGNYWEYVDSVFYASDSIEVYHYSWAVVGRGKILSRNDSIEVYIFRIKYSPETQNDYFFKNNPEGLTLYSNNEFDSAGNYSLRSLLIKYPLQVGDTWVTNHGDYGDINRCLAANTLFTVLGHSFHCYEIQTGAGAAYYAVQYYSVGFGKVAGFSYSNYSDVPRFSKTTLLSYTIN